MTQRFLSLLIAAGIGLLLVVWSGRVASGEDVALPPTEPAPLSVYVFWKTGCPYCTDAKAEIDSLLAENPRFKLESLEVGVEAAVDDLYTKTLLAFGLEQAAVPLVVIGDNAFLGFYDGDRSANAYRQAMKACADNTCADVVAKLGEVSGKSGSAARSPTERGAVTVNNPAQLPDIVTLPFFGDVQTGSLSLPALTILMAAIDGFNPCAMWVLVVLIGLLLGLEDERRMWILGGAFLFATAVMYFAVMAAWLNLILFLGAVMWVRIGVGALAIGGGLFFLREYWTKPEAVCRVTNPDRRQKIMATFQKVVNTNGLVLSVIGIMALAVLVNLIELLCSAGIPAVYTQILVLSDLPMATYYGYMLLYISVFMADDVAIFATAMFALRVAGLTGTYARISHLVGGIVLLVIGAIMLLRPDLLSFG